MINPWGDDPYPIHACPYTYPVIEQICTETNAVAEIAAPVLFSVMAASVQTAIDIKAPWGSIFPPSLYFLVLAPSVSGKSAVRDLFKPAFEEFEHGYMQPKNESPYNDSLIDESSKTGSHTYLLEDATEGGIIDLYQSGAYALHVMPDEAAPFLRKMDMAAACKRYDGSPIRQLSRTHGSVLLNDRRMSICLMTQEATFNRIMEKKGEQLIESGLVPRMLISFGRRPIPSMSAHLSYRFKSTGMDVSAVNSRIKELLQKYSLKLQANKQQRCLLQFTPGAIQSLQIFKGALDSNHPFWTDVAIFAARAPDLVMRLAGVLQYFHHPQPTIEAWAVDSASKIVGWHLREAKRHFGVPPVELQMHQLSETLWAYLVNQANLIGKFECTRSELLRQGPKAIRSAENLNLALHSLLIQGRVALERHRNTDYIKLHGMPSLIANSIHSSRHN